MWPAGTQARVHRANRQSRLLWLGANRTYAARGSRPVSARNQSLGAPVHCFGTSRRRQPFSLGWLRQVPTTLCSSHSSVSFPPFFAAALNTFIPLHGYYPPASKHTLNHPCPPLVPCNFPPHAVAQTRRPVAQRMSCLRTSTTPSRPVTTSAASTCRTGENVRGSCCFYMHRSSLYPTCLRLHATRLCVRARMCSAHAMESKWLDRRALERAPCCDKSPAGCHATSCHERSICHCCSCSALDCRC